MADLIHKSNARAKEESKKNVVMIKSSFSCAVDSLVSEEEEVKELPPQDHSGPMSPVFKERMDPNVERLRMSSPHKRSSDKVAVDKVIN